VFYGVIGVTEELVKERGKKSRGEGGSGYRRLNYGAFRVTKNRKKRLYFQSRTTGGIAG